MKEYDSNFKGDWDARCDYCARRHREHMTSYEGLNYRHRTPCDQERQHIRAEMRKRVRFANGLVGIIYFGEYLWSRITGLIPFYNEVSLIRKLRRIGSKRKRLRTALTRNTRRSGCS